MSDHEWCRDVRRDEAVRAAEDAAAVPTIQHRDLPEAVAALTERVARLEEAVMPKSVSASDAEGPENKGGTMPAIDPGPGWRLLADDEVIEQGDEWLTPPYYRNVWRTTCYRGGGATPRKTGETYRRRVVADATIGTGDVFRDVQRGSTAEEIARLTAERDAAIRERDEARARVAVLKAATPPRGWLTVEEREQVRRARDELLSGTDGYENEFANEKRRRAGVLTDLLARETPPRVKRRGPWTISGVPGDGSQAWKPMIDATLSHRDAEWIAAIRAAGGEVEE